MKSPHRNQRIPRADLAAVRDQVDDTDLAKPADPHLTETLDLSGPGPGFEDLGGES